MRDGTVGSIAFSAAGQPVNPIGAYLSRRNVDEEAAVTNPESIGLTRRTLAARAASSAAAVLAPGIVDAREGTPALPSTPECDDGDDAPTPRQTEGPYFTPDSPERADLREPGMAGTPLRLRGYVLTTACEPIAGAMMEFWQADDAGVYDNEGYRLRGHQFTDEDGRWALATIVPGLYPGRTRHVHVRVQPPGGELLVTQLYFPDVPENANDVIFDPELLVEPDADAPAGETAARFDFVLG